VTIKVGDKIPDLTLARATPTGPEEVRTADFFGGRRVALFAVPGAFTPTCSARHLPGFVEQADALKARGVDEIACTSVNDAFVLSAWAEASGAGGITMLADGNGDFAKALGLSIDSSRHGMGIRSRRYSMLVADGVVEQLNLEEPGAYEVSSADYLVGQI